MFSYIELRLLERKISGKKVNAVGEERTGIGECEGKLRTLYSVFD